MSSEIDTGCEKIGRTPSRPYTHRTVRVRRGFSDMQRGTRDAFRTSHVVFRSCRGEKPIGTRDGTPSSEGADEARRAFGGRGATVRPRCRSPRRNDLCASLEAFLSYAAPHRAADKVFSGSADRLRGIGGSGFPTLNAFYRHPNNCRPSVFPCKRTQGGGRGCRNRRCGIGLPSL